MTFRAQGYVRPERLVRRGRTDQSLRDTFEITMGDMTSQRGLQNFEDLTTYLRRRGVDRGTAQEMNAVFAEVYQDRARFNPSDVLQMDIGYVGRGFLRSGQVRVTRAEVREQGGGLVQDYTPIE